MRGNSCCQQRYRIISVTPAGRERYLRILIPYLLRNRHVIDEHHFWLNTNNSSDISFIESVQREHPTFFKINRKETFCKHSLFESIWQYWIDYTDEDTLYIRFDDDICFVAPGAIEDLIRFRMLHPEPFLVFGNIVNNALCTHLLQRKRVIPETWGRVSHDCMDRNGWGNPRFAAKVHRKFLDGLHKDRLDEWTTDDWTIADYSRFSINIVSWFGKDLKEVEELGIPDLKKAKVSNPFTGLPVEGEEPFISQVLPARYARPCMLCGKAIFAHFAFYTQRPYLENATNLLEYYRMVSEGENGLFPWLIASLTDKTKKLAYYLHLCFSGITRLLRAMTMWGRAWKKFKSFALNTNTRAKTYLMIRFPSFYSELRLLKRKLLRFRTKGASKL